MKKVDKETETLTRNIILFLAFQHRPPSLLYQSLIQPLVNSLIMGLSSTCG